MEEIGNAVDVSRMLAEVGPKVRRARSERGMTLEGLSEASGVSVGHLSRLESGGRQPSLATLLNVAAGLEVSISELVEERPRPPIVVRGDSPFFDAHGTKVQSLTPPAGPAGLSAVRVVFPAGLKQDEHRRPDEPEFHRHEGEEWLFVVSGQLRLTLGEEVVELGAGDAAYFDGMLRHAFEVVGPEDAHLLMVSGALGRDLTKLHHRHSQHETDAGTRHR
ncbi:helix-turn-helix domain-containing protein [Rubrobacter indicoceani]|uniref:helix-turn-helix domain-containing protein n=1 Tax=Rubrobacter indicoceani TaxID=2051957 RepID=UPI000E5A81A2|nr:XRE family transcriptional regulator [Rubrobacter indicoceani]